MAERVVVAMSGGVDSSVALAVLKDRGYDCIGMSMQLWDYSEREGKDGGTGGSCCSLEDIHDARTVAASLGVPFYVVNVREAFSREVVDYFVSSYLAGSTPNPCIKCNEILKFEVLLKKALSIEAGYLATGHYARIVRSDEGLRLLKGVDEAKDQSYFLFTMTKEQLGRVLFPLGDMTKPEVRKYARRLGLKTSDKEESQEICFIEDGRYGEFLAGRAGEAPGDIVDLSGRRLGEHRGLFNYTIGQRKGLNLSGGPYYVLDIDPSANRVVVGPEEGLYVPGLTAQELNWIAPEAEAEFSSPGFESITARIRYRHRGAGCSVKNDGGRAVVTFDEPQRAVTPGQAVVFYRGDEVLGGGWIEGPLKEG